MKSDRQLQRDVLEALRREPGVPVARIGVTVRAGVVLLTGRLPVYREKLAAEGVAQRVRGVRAVANDIEVRPPGGRPHTDADIALAAADALNWAAGLPDGLVRIGVACGWITLEGTVDWQHQKVAAERAARTLAGAVGVTSRIAVKPRPAEAPDREATALPLQGRVLPWRGKPWPVKQ